MIQCFWVCEFFLDRKSGSKFIIYYLLIEPLGSLNVLILDYPRIIEKLQKQIMIFRADQFQTKSILIILLYFKHLKIL